MYQAIPTMYQLKINIELNTNTKLVSIYIYIQYNIKLISNFYSVNINTSWNQNKMILNQHWLQP